MTPEGSFPAYKVADDYPEPPEGWGLVVGGLVAKPMRLTVEDLMRLSRTDLRCRHHCVEGWSGVSSWHGVRLSEVATLVGAHPAARYVRFRSFEKDGQGIEYSSSWDLESAAHPQTLLAFGRNGRALEREYGGPVRLYSAVKLGYKQVKWLQEVTFTDQRTGGYWEDQGYEWWAGV
jgi:DMSO/TMAO reductase YedYZ molybdopterin-dependent catalytic subunit